ncbi:unnamed protein product, partial [marine sediment metagenome]
MLLRRINWLRLLLAVMDAVVINAAFVVALWLRFEGSIPAEYGSLYLRTTGWITPLVILSCYALGLYNRVWDYASTDAALVVVLGISIGFGLATLVMVFDPHLMYPRSVLAMAWLMSILGIGGGRFAWRDIRRRQHTAKGRMADVERRRVLVYGAGHAGTMLSRHIATDPDAPYEVVGFVDDDPHLAGMIAASHRVLGTGEQLADLVARHDIAEVILA